MAAGGGKTRSIEAVRCPCCKAALDIRTPEIVCPNCRQNYPRLGNIPILFRDPQKYLQSCNRQLALLEQQAVRTVRSIEEQLQTPGLLPATKERCRAMIDAVRGQTADIRAVLHPLLGDAPPEVLPEETPAPLQYIHYLYRDWGWPSDANGENEQALAALVDVAAGAAFGSILVLGAGGCRLAYDLHRRDPDAETIVVDIDPFLFATAQQVIRGGSLTMKEANSEINDQGSVVKEWLLKAPNGAIEEDRFHFILANGLEPPFAPETFDTVVTPWFIDLVPSDLRNFISEVRRLLKPGGRWLNLGPLHYRPEVPLTRRFAREEVFDLAVRAGFRVDQWSAGSMPYLVSKLNGRGKVEWVLAFAATKLDAIPSGGAIPAWLLFRHIPIPVFPGQSMFSTEDPAEQIVLSVIDGHHTLDEIAAILALKAGESGLSMDQFREIVRRCLVEIHPDCSGT